MKLTIEIDDPEVVAALKKMLDAPARKAAPVLEPATVDQRALDAANAELDELPLLLRTARKAANEAVRRKFTLTTPQMNTLMRTRHTRGNYVADKLLEEYRTQFAEQKATDQKDTEARLLELTRRKREVTEARKSLLRAARKKPSAKREDATGAVLREVFILGVQALTAKGGKR